MQSPKRIFPVLLAPLLPLLLLGLVISAAAKRPALGAGDLHASLAPGIDPGAVSPAAPLAIVFSQPMDAGSALPAILTLPYTPGEIAWNDTFTQATFTPQAGFTPRGDYLVFLNQDLRSAGGEHFALSPQWEIHILTPPRVIGRTPAGPEVNERKPSTIRLIFDRAMDAGSVAAAFQIQPALAYELAWENPQNLRVHLLKPLGYAARYRFSLAGAARDVEGIPMLEDYAWEYWMGDFRFEAAPQSGQVTDRLTLAFNQPLDAARTGEPFDLRPAISGTWSWPDQRTARFIAAGSFAPGIWYSLSFSDTLIDTFGSPITLTEVITFSAKPPIASVTPKPDSEDNCKNIQITFSHAMDHATTEAAFQTNPQMKGKFSWQDNTLIFSPALWMAEYYRQYEITLQTTARDAQGQPVLVEPFTWSFRCLRYAGENYIENPNPVSLNTHYGANIQVLDAEGRRALHFVNNEEGTPLQGSLTATLYRFGADEFAQRYSKQAWAANLPEDTFKTWQVMLTGETFQEFFIPRSTPPGLYILRLSLNAQENQPPDKDDYLMLAITYNTLILKHGVGQLAVWISDISGYPGGAGAEMYVYDWHGKLLGRGRADKNGYFEMPLSGLRHPGLVLARTISSDGEDFAIAGTSNRWTDISCWYCFRNSDLETHLPQLTQMKVYAYTDQPIYHPGQRVYFKAIVRAEDNGSYTLPPAGAAATVRLLDERDNLLQTLDLQINAAGSLEGSFTLGMDGEAGSYSLDFVILGENHRQSFRVLDNRKPDFFVTVNGEAGRYIDGEQMKILIETRYFFGQPVANAKLEIRMHRAWDVNYWWNGESSDGDGDERYAWVEKTDFTFTGVTDASGRYTLDIKARAPDFGYGPTGWWEWQGDSLGKLPYAIEVSAEDGSGQVSTSYVIVQVFSAAERIGLDFPGGLYQLPGQPFTVTAHVRTLDDAPVTGRKLNLLLRLYPPKGEEGVIITDTVIISGADGSVSLPFTLSGPGSCFVELSGEDAQGHWMRVGEYLRIGNRVLPAAYNKAPVDEQSDRDYIELITDRNTYQPGQTARFIIHSTFSGPALLTFERRQVYRTLKVFLTAPQTVIDTPILEIDAPYFVAMINAWQPMSSSLARYLEEYPDTPYNPSLPDSRMRIAYVDVQVDASFRKLNVSISSDRQVFIAGDQATFTIQVTDAQGKPAAAELSLALTDEAIFALNSELSPPIFSAFYSAQPRYHVRPFDSMAPSRELSPGYYDQFTVYHPSVELHGHFQDTAAWIPILETGTDGLVTATLRLPDNLTSWRLTVRAATADTLVGEGHINILTQRPVVVQPVLPRSLVVSDTVALAALVHNYGAARTFTVTLTSDQFEIPTPAQVVSLETGEVRKVEWLVIARRPGQAQIVMQAEAQDGAGSDAVQLPLVIQDLASAYVASEIGSFRSQFSAALVAPENALPSSTVKLRINRSIAANLLQGLEYLTGYPYGCVEQTMSRALPNAAFDRALGKLGQQELNLHYNLPKMVNAGLVRLYAMQHMDGGWGWWHDDDTHDYQTAWVVFGLAVTAQAGYEVSPQALENGAKWLAEHLDEMDIRTLAFALYSLALAGRPQHDASLALFDEAYQLDAFSQAALALALHEVGEEETAQAVLDSLAASAVKSTNGMYWPVSKEDGEYYHKTMASATRSTALALQAFMRLRSQDKNIPEIARYLMNQRSADGWGSTNETAFAILALIDYVAANEIGSEARIIHIQLNGQEILSATLDAATPYIEVTIPITQIVAGLNPLMITQEGEGLLYYSLTSRILIAHAALQGAGSPAITRRYLDQKTKKPLQSFTMGQLVRVEIQIDNPEPGSYIMIEDHLPGGLEALNTALNTTGHQGLVDEDGKPSERFFWRDYGYNNKKIHGGRVIFFITQMNPGKIHITYLARAVQPGSFTALPAELTAMYNAQVWSRSASARINVVSTEAAAAKTSGDGAGMTWLAILVINLHLSRKSELIIPSTSPHQINP